MPLALVVAPPTPTRKAEPTCLHDHILPAHDVGVALVELTVTRLFHIHNLILVDMPHGRP